MGLTQPTRSSTADSFQYQVHSFIAKARELEKRVQEREGSGNLRRYVCIHFRYQRMVK
jgi:hypothetical protein